MTPDGTTVLDNPETFAMPATAEAVTKVLAEVRAQLGIPERVERAEGVTLLPFVTIHADAPEGLRKLIKTTYVNWEMSPVDQPEEASCN